jgi:hypothetical protein
LDVVIDVCSQVQDFQAVVQDRQVFTICQQSVAIVMFIITVIVGVCDKD